jgi:hypothetical protein
MRLFSRWGYLGLIIVLTYIWMSILAYIVADRTRSTISAIAGICLLTLMERNR